MNRQNLNLFIFSDYLLFLLTFIGCLKLKRYRITKIPCKGTPIKKTYQGAALIRCKKMLKINVHTKTVPKIKFVIFRFFLSFKTSKIMNKTVRTILQAISYLITLLIGATGGATLM